MTSFKLKLAFFSTFLLMLTHLQYSASNVYNEHKTNASIANIETEANDSWEDECELKPIGISSRIFITDPKKTWDNATIPYSISFSDFDAFEKQLIMEAINHIQNISCVKFVEKTRPHQGVVSIGKSLGCKASHYGKSSDPQSVDHKICAREKFCIIHELMHIMGFAHEQSRYDRDKYITLHWENIFDDKKHNFEKVDNISFTTAGFPYDYDSVMHYSDAAFSKNGKQIMTPLMNVKNYKLGQRNHISKYDILKINALNNCKIPKYYIP